jgi:sec-independent protein translocase protein TatA
MFVGPQESMIVLLIVILLFGGSKVPELARSLGKAKSEFQKGLDEGGKEPTTKEG